MTGRPLALCLAVGLVTAATTSGARAGDEKALERFVTLYCAGCHAAEEPAGGLSLEGAGADVVGHPEVWEKVVRKLATRQMPPDDAVRPSGRTYEAVIAALTAELDREAEAHPSPGRTETFRRLTRAEYRNAVRDLLAVEIDVDGLLPADQAGHGFDNVTVSDLSPTLLERYIRAAQRISRLAVGTPLKSPDVTTFRVAADLTQEEQLEGLPLGTRGGTRFRFQFPTGGEYEIGVRLARDRNEQVEGLREPNELVVLLDREERARLTVNPPRSPTDHMTADAGLKARMHVAAGARDVGVTFVKGSASLAETKRRPYQARFNVHRHPRRSPAVFQVTITGPFEAGKGTDESPSRRKLFVRRPTGPADEEACAREILLTLMRRAYRRPVDDEDLRRPLALYREARATGDFDAGVESAVAAVLVSPGFLFRVEADPPDAPHGSAYRLSDVELASRLSFFLWGSVPDDELLGSAERGELGRTECLDRQVRRMLADPRSRSLVGEFAGQWLHLRNLDAFTPDLRLFPDFDDNLRQALRRETELLFEDVIRNDRPVTHLLGSDRAFLNERLAKHYGVPFVYGSRFREVDVADWGRGGLLRQGSVLTVTSYADRTSPVIRGKWVLENILGTPPPPPPANVPALKDNTVAATLSVRDRLAEHRRSESCAGCHRLMDPVGLALENYDAAGRFRTMEAGRPVDASGGLPDGSRFTGVEGLQRAVLKRPELFATTLTEKLMTYALGRGLNERDAPAVRKVVREASGDGYRFSSIVRGIVVSIPFRMRTAE